MSEIQKKATAQVIKKPLLKIALKVTLIVTLMLTLMALVISLPPVQTAIIKKITTSFNTKTGYIITLDGINISWFDEVVVDNITLVDKSNFPIIQLQKASLDFNIINLLSGNELHFDEGEISGVRVTMYRPHKDSVYSLNQFIYDLREMGGTSEKTRKSQPFVVDHVRLSDGVFVFANSGRDSIEGRFNHNYFTIKDVNGVVKNLTITPGDFYLETVNLQAIDSATQLAIKGLNCKYRYTPNSMIFRNMTLTAGQSFINNSMIFNYASTADLSDFNTKVTIVANFRQSLIHTRDLGVFAPTLKRFDQYFRLRGFFDGSISHFTSENLIVEFGRSSRIEGDISMDGLPDVSSTFVNANISSSRLNVGDLRNFLSPTAFVRASKFGDLSFRARFTGFFSDFVSDGSFETSIGFIDTDLNLKINEDNRDASSYSGKLTTRNLDLGKLIEDTVLFQNLDMSGQIHGQGFTVEQADIKLNAQIDSIGINGYIYSGIKTDARFASEFFAGLLSIDDPNLKFDAQGSIDFRENREIINLNANLDTAKLYNLGLTKKYSMLSSKINVDMQGLQIDKALGYASLYNIDFSYDTSYLHIDTLKLLSTKDSISRTLTINSPLVDLKVLGNYDYTTLLADAKKVYQEFKLNLLNRSEEMDAYYITRDTLRNDYYYLDFDLQLKDITPLVMIFEPTFFLSPGTAVVGSFTGGRTGLIDLYTEFDRLDYKGNGIMNNTLSVRSSFLADSSNIDAVINFSSEYQLKNGEPRFRDFATNIYWKNKVVNFDAKGAQYNSTNQARLSGQADFLPGITKIHLDPSELMLIEKTWRFKEENFISYRGKTIEMSGIELYNEEQSITVNGVISEDPNENLFISIRNFDLATLTPLTGRELGGVLSGYADVRNYYTKREINSRLNIQNFSLHEFEIGDISTNINYDNRIDKFNTNMFVNYAEEKTIEVSGFIDPREEYNQLDLKAKMTDANLQILEPIFISFISDVSGTVDGEMKITGRMQTPIINGNATIYNGQLQLDLLKTVYQVSGDVTFDNNELIANDLKVTDVRNNLAILSGKIMHSGLQDIRFNLKGVLNNFQVLNTTSRDNDYFYGTGYATGELFIEGEKNNVNISANVVSDKGTKIYIPLEGSSSIEQEEFIQFVTVADTTNQRDTIFSKNKPQTIQSQTVTLDFDVELTPDALCEMIFDINAGDIIRGRGNGKLNIQYDTKGEFYMFGEYNFTEGGYNFTLKNIINKEFEILPDSKIQWTGDPYDATLNLKASYRQVASLLPILNVSEDAQNNTEIKRRYPSFVILDLQGPLMSPEITFDIDIQDYPRNLVVDGASLDSRITAFKNRLHNDEQEMNRQVFSLIILKNFSPEDYYNLSGSVGSSMSEFLSNQVSYWVSQIDENLMIDLDLNTLDADALSTFQLRMSYSFLDGRLLVTRDGGFTNQDKSADVASVLGDWTVEYMLTENGKYRVKVYNKSNYNSTRNTLETKNSTTTGFSLMHTHSFNNWEEFIDGILNREKRKKKKETPPATPEILEDEDVIYTP